MHYLDAIEFVGAVIDVAGVAAIVVGAIIATGVAVRALLLRRGAAVYVPFRRSLGRSILLGLELLVAADLIRTVAVEPTLESVAR